MTCCHNPYFNRWFSAILKQKILSTVLTPVTILILIDGFLQWNLLSLKMLLTVVTILILIDGFLQFGGVIMNTPLFEMSQSLF